MGSSVGISKARDRDQLLAGLQEAARHDSRLVVERGVAARELECAVLGRQQLKASVVGEISFDADWYDYDTKYTDGCSQTLIPAPTSRPSERPGSGDCPASLYGCSCLWLGTGGCFLR